ncbi:glycerophosphodiester phosphodiesterase family protein [Parabacteroides sp. OttesenSCG-928-G07]|nr:glycerophosphodiester phosphodiesterase family protein [Parabacteroides sp. OttesenSCG-928-G21]MDL2277958.1 glycerophosphodiester phosphodiesterase family protein [Parabacteroides sp. OttesenSCG-928-G07]
MAIFSGLILCCKTLDHLIFRTFAALNAITVMNEKTRWLIVLISTVLISLSGCNQKVSDLSSTSQEKRTELQEYFSYKADQSILISGHRGGREPGFPENSLEGFQNVLNQTTAFFEIDPRLTKDSVIVLMHDDTLERTTNASGKLKDFTWEELQSVRLKDSDGNVTTCKIPTLEEVILWSKEKTVVNLDKKDVPMEMIVDLIRKCEAEDYIMLTVHTGAQARYYYDRFPNIMLSAFARNDKEYEDLAIAGVPWENMIAYVGPSINESNRHIVEKLRKNGVRCMISVAPTHDRKTTSKERAELYLQEINLQPDIIESDYPTEVDKVLKRQGVQ